MTEELNKRFNSRCCNICEKSSSLQATSSTKLLMCNKCKLIFYCGKDHQKIDWKRHKEFCQTISKILDDRKIKHILDIQGSIKAATRFHLQKVKVFIKTVLMCLLKRDLTSAENELIFFANICFNCNEYDYKKLIICQQCKGVSYCSNHAVQNYHNLICEQLNIYYSYCKIDIGVNLWPQTKPFSQNFEIWPPNLIELIKETTQTSNLLEPLPRNNIEFQWFSAACNYSNVATILYTISISMENKYFELTNLNTLNIYIVGASSEITLFTSNECWLLSYCLPSIKQIQLHFIGPELPFDNDTGCNQTDTVKTFYIQSTYEQFSENLSVNKPEEKPSLIICFNCGFSEYSDAKHNPWYLALNKMMQKNKNIPIAFTSYTSHESFMDNLIVNDVSQINQVNLITICKNIINPYRDLRPYRNMQCENEMDEIYYYNGYLNVVLIKDAIN